MKSMTRRRLLLWLCLLLVLVGAGFSAVYRTAWAEEQRTDYTVYTAAGQAILDHTDLYQAQNVRGWKYVYPPPFALLMVPFAKLPLALGSLLWYLLECACIAAVSLMSVRLIKPWLRAEHGELFYAIPLVSLSVILIGGAMRGQASALMFMLMVATFYFQQQGRAVQAGISLAAATVIKVFPIVLALYFVWRRQWRALLATLAGLALLGLILPSLLLGWQRNLNELREWVEVVARPAMLSNAERASATPLYEQLMDTSKPRNQSLESLFLSVGANPQLSKRLVEGTAALMLLVMFYAARVVRSRLDELALIGAFLAWSLLVPPISEAHYFGALILPLTVLLARLLYEIGAGPLQQRRWLAFGVVSMLIVMLLVREDSTAVWRPLCLATLLIWALAIQSILRGKAARPALVEPSATPVGC